ncbi:peptide deformylase [Desulfurivibrio sp. D14AmB]|uniref:peptide deformylase n=1 Tax=Desulfurivibrio sp. D14AmB TaxID=3374370 RepID=UPI00376EEF45
MAILPIVKFPEAVLKGKARPVTVFDEQLRRLVADMIDTMHAAPGVGLAAPQVGVPLQLVVIAGRVASRPGEPGEEREAEAPLPDGADDADDADDAAEERRRPSLVLINPRIVSGEGQQVDEEGCLSVRDYCSNVKRLARIRVEALDLEGRPLNFEAEDFFARVIQHELDHLEGTLFIDRISSLKRSLYRKKLKKILADQQEEL